MLNAKKSPCGTESRGDDHAWVQSQGLALSVINSTINYDNQLLPSQSQSGGGGGGSSGSMTSTPTTTVPVTIQ